MKILIVNFYGDIEYFESMIRGLSVNFDVSSFPLFKYLKDETSRIPDALHMLYNEVSKVNIVLWQCLHILDIHDLRYIIQVAPCCHGIYLSVDDRPPSRYDDEYLKRMSMMDIVITSSKSSISCYDKKGVLIPPIPSAPVDTNNDVKCKYDALICTDYAMYDSFYAFDIQQIENIYKSSIRLSCRGVMNKSELLTNKPFEWNATPEMFKECKLFLNVFQSKYGGPSIAMVQAAMYNIPILSPSTPDINEFFEPGIDYIVLDHDSYIDTIRNCLYMNDFGKMTNSAKNKIGNWEIVGDKLKGCHIHYPLDKSVQSIPARMLDPFVSLDVQKFDWKRYKFCHKLNVNSFDAAWKHYLTIGYPNGMFFCMKRSDMDYDIDILQFLKENVDSIDTVKEVIKGYSNPYHTLEKLSNEPNMNFIIDIFNQVYFSQ